jgi:small subunit ribosomal protein S17
MAEPIQIRGHRKERVGEVVSDKMTKTIIVRVERRFRHPQFKKVVTAYSKLYAHDENERASLGDLVRVEETRPMSRSKRWRLVEILNPDGSVKAAA